MMRSEPRKEDLNVDIVLRSGITTRGDKGKQLEESVWVCKAPIKEPRFDLECMIWSGGYPEREHGTINYSASELHALRGAHRNRMSQGSCSCMEGCVST